MALPDILQRLIQLQGLLFATYVYCVMVIRPLRPGLPRLLASLPAFAVFSLSPYFVKDSAVLSSGIGLTTMWVANFKLLAYSGGRGALSHPGLRSGLQWGTLLVLPFFPAKGGRAPAQASTGAVVFGLLVKLGVWLGLTALLVSVQLSALARHLIYAVHFWMFISLCLDAAMPLGRHLLAGIPLQPAMDAPYASVSVREFWGRRYNQIVSATLLETIYKPIVEGRWLTTEAAEAVAAAGAHADKVSAPALAKGGDLNVRAGPPPPTDGRGAATERRTPLWLALTGLIASFVVSGIMHEICMWYSCVGRLEGSFRMMGFFLVQPLFILAQESAMAAVVWLVPEQWRAVNAMVVGGRALLRASSWLLLLQSAEWFWGSIESCGADKRGLQEIDGAMQWLLALARTSGLLAQ